MQCDLDEMMLQMTAKSSASMESTNLHSIALSMEKNQWLALKIKHLNSEHTLQLEHDKRLYENANTAIIHERAMASKEAQILLEKAKAELMSESLKLKQMEVEALKLELLIRGVNTKDG